MKTILLLLFSTIGFAQGIPGISTSVAPSATPGWSLVAHTTCGSTGGGADCTTPAINCTGATLIVASLAFNGGNAAVIDSLSNTYTLVNHDGFTALLYSISPTVSSSMTFSSNLGSPGYPSVFVQCWSESTPPIFDQFVNNTVTGTTIQPGPITPSVNNSLIVTTLTSGTGLASIAINDSFTISDSQLGVLNDNFAGALAYFIQPTSASINPTWTVNLSATLNGIIASFKP